MQCKAGRIDYASAMQLPEVPVSWTAWLNRPLFAIGQAEMTPATLLTIVLYAGLIWWLASLLERAMLRLGARGSADGLHASRMHLLSRLARYSVWILGTVMALAHVGIDLSSVALVGGAIGVGLGFGLQNIFSNFVAGIIILLERSLKVGDFVELQSGVQGHVREIAMRYTHIATNDSMDVLVPNSEFINGRVVNWTLDDSLRRMRVPFGISYNVPKEQVLEAGVAAARRIEGVIVAKGREPTVWLVNYGDSSMNYELVIWADRALTCAPGSTHARLMWALDDELRARGIEIPFPQRDLHVRSGRLDVRLQRDRGDAVAG